MAHGGLGSRGNVGDVVREEAAGGGTRGPRRTACYRWRREGASGARGGGGWS
jgi:hypothetical protein